MKTFWLCTCMRTKMCSKLTNLPRMLMVLCRNDKAQHVCFWNSMTLTTEGIDHDCSWLTKSNRMWKVNSRRRKCLFVACVQKLPWRIRIKHYIKYTCVCVCVCVCVCMCACMCVCSTIKSTGEQCAWASNPVKLLVMNLCCHLTTSTKHEPVAHILVTNYQCSASGECIKYNP